MIQTLPLLTPALYLVATTAVVWASARWSWSRYRESRHLVDDETLEDVAALRRDRLARSTLALMAGKDPSNGAPDLCLHRDVLDRWAQDREDLRRLRETVADTDDDWLEVVGPASCSG